MSNQRELKRRINTVASTAKITGAIRMITSAKVHKTEVELSHSEPYHDAIRQILTHLYATDNGNRLQSEFLTKRPVKRLALVVFGSDGGLCGAYNINILKETEKIITTLEAEHVETDIYPVGNKLRHIFKTAKLQGVNILPHPELKAEASAEQIISFSKLLRDRFAQHEVDKVLLLFMHYKSMAHQTLCQQTLFPMEPLQTNDATDNIDPLCIMEPNAADILNNILPMYATSMTVRAFKENAASTYAARMIAMQTANENASKLNDELILEYNKIRQEGITTELLDIQGGQIGQ